MISKGQTLAEQLRSVYEGQRVGFISGNFNLVHAGHIRLMFFAAELCDVLLVGLSTTDTSVGNFPAELRLESIRGISCVTEAFVLDQSIVEFLDILRPDVVFKGKEHENRDNDESRVIERYGGKLLFGTDEISFSTLRILENEFSNAATFANHHFSDETIAFQERHKIDGEALAECLDSFENLNVVVVGDLIVDDYVQCEPLGMSQEDPTIVVAPQSKARFIGGAGIVACHAAALGATVSFFSVAGEDSEADFAVESMAVNNVQATLLRDEARPTTLKTRYRAKGKTLLRVNRLRQNEIPLTLQTKLLKKIKSSLGSAHVLIFSDFSYGCLTRPMIEDLVKFAGAKSVFMAADSQSSSQKGDLKRFKGVNLITPTEHEARMAMDNTQDGLVVLANRMNADLDVDHVVITLGAEGVLAFSPHGEPADLTTDRLPALNPHAIDVAGAGDSMLVTMSLAMSSRQSIWLAIYLGSLAAKVQVGRVGNVPISAAELRKAIK